MPVAICAKESPTSLRPPRLPIGAQRQRGTLCEPREAAVERRRLLCTTQSTRSRPLGTVPELARDVEGPPYGGLVVADRFFETYEINFFSLRRCAKSDWKLLKGREWLEWLAASWALRLHFRVALRKLRYQSQDSFRIVPLDEGIESERRRSRNGVHRGWRKRFDSCTTSARSICAMTSTTGHTS